MRKNAPAAVIAQLDAIYRQLPRVECQRRCGVACGPMLLTDGEARRIQHATHRAPRTLPMVHQDPGTVRCVYLAPDQRACTAYATRPLICRVWGVTKQLSCPAGCVPDRWLSPVDFVRLAQDVERIAGPLYRTGPDGLTKTDGFLSMVGLRMKPRAVIESDAERTRSLRAIFGGRILAAAADYDPNGDE